LRSAPRRADTKPAPTRDLLAVENRAIKISDVDFGCTERQVRTLEYQKTLVARGVSKTLKSNHLVKKDLSGKTQVLYGHANDLVPYVNGQFVWDWEKIYHVASAMARAAKELDLLDKICWGGVWDKPMSAYFGDGRWAAMKAAVEAYKARHAGADFIDGPHFQIYSIG
jgi:peptidoglycan L-alanyl-D-glutamate endopeptidase CwlK